MTCRPCVLIGQYALNWANLLDHAANTLLLGDANETVSVRIARARNVGRRWATWACRCLTLVFGRDHCSYVLDCSVLPNSREIWDWNTGRLRDRPKTLVDTVELERE